MIIPNENGNDPAMRMLLDKRPDGTYEADGVWLYADQAKNYNCTNARLKNLPISWDCNIWDGFGTKFAYIHTGMMDHAINGTTLTISRKGSGLNSIVNPCIEKFMKTKEYTKICEDFNLTDDCYKNEFFES
jgi:hypothetical protein